MNAMNLAQPSASTINARRSTLERMLHPLSIAIVGASPKFAKVNGRPLKHLIDKGYAGRIYPVNPNYPEIAGHACYPDIAIAARGSRPRHRRAACARCRSVHRRARRSAAFPPR